MIHVKYLNTDPPLDRRKYQIIRKSDLFPVFIDFSCSPTHHFRSNCEKTSEFMMIPNWWNAWSVKHYLDINWIFPKKYLKSVRNWQNAVLICTDQSNSDKKYVFSNSWSKNRTFTDKIVCLATSNWINLDKNWHTTFRGFPLCVPCVWKVPMLPQGEILTLFVDLIVTVLTKALYLWIHKLVASSIVSTISQIWNIRFSSHRSPENSRGQLSHHQPASSVSFLNPPKDDQSLLAE